MASSPIALWEILTEGGSGIRDILFSWAPKSLLMMTAAPWTEATFHRVTKSQTDWGTKPHIYDTIWETKTWKPDAQFYEVCPNIWSSDYYT